MKERCTKVFAVVLIAMISMSMVLTGCGGNSQNSNTATTTTAQENTQNATDSSNATQETKYSWQEDTSPFNFDLYFFASWGTGYPWHGTQVEKYITEDTGVTPNIIIPTGNDKEYLNVMIASDDLPDAMILEWNSPETKKLIESGKIYSINELSEQYAPEFMDMIPEDVTKYHSKADGKLYYLPSFMPSKQEWDESLEKHNARPLFIQKGIYEALGSPAVDTPDKLLALLKEVKAKYPDVKPFAIEPPLDVVQWNSLCGSETLTYFAGIFAPETYSKDLYLENDQVKMIFENPNFVEAVRFLNTLYKEGLISTDILMTKAESASDNYKTAQYAVTGMFPIDVWKTYNPNIMSLYNDEGKTYMPLEIMSYNGKQAQFAGTRGAGWVASMVTKNAKDPGRIIRYFEYSWSDEGQIANLFGREGETFEFVNGVPKYLPAVSEEMQKDPNALADKYGFESKLLMWRSKWGSLQKLAVSPVEFTNYLESVQKYAVDIWDMGLDNLDPNPTSSEGIAYAKVKSIWNKYLSKMVLAKDDAEFDASYAAGMKEIEEAGLEKIKKVMTENHLADMKVKAGK